MFDELKRPIKEIRNEVGNFVNLKITYFELRLQRDVVKIFSNLIFSLIVGMFLVMLLLMLSLAFVFWFGQAVGPLYVGFLIMAGFYLILGVLVFLNRKHWIYYPLEKRWIKKQRLHIKDLEDLPNPEKMSDMDDWIELIDLKAERSKIILEELLENISEELTPRHILQNILNQINTMANAYRWVMKDLFHIFKKKA